MTGLAVVLVVAPILVGAVVLTLRELRREASGEESPCMFCEPGAPCEAESAPEPAPAAVMPMVEMAGLYSDDDYVFGPMQAWCEASTDTEPTPSTGATS